jgi:hypothetical protein
MSGKKTRITAFVANELAKKFTDLTRRIGISGTALLNRTLPAELDYLANLPANSERAAAAQRFYDGFVDSVVGDDEDPPNRHRLNITLDRENAERMDRLCREKRVPRDGFIGLYLDFLVNGAEGVCEAPLGKISEMLMNPRREYDEKRRTSPAADETFYNPETSEFMVVKAVPLDNPYIGFHVDEEQLSLWERLMRKSGARENR